jgi:uncharacterized protein (DUF1330 family)
MAGDFRGGPLRLFYELALHQTLREPARRSNDGTCKEATMRMYLTVAASMAAGIVIGGVAVQGLHAQGKKAYTVTENQVVDAQLAADFARRVATAQAAAGGRNFNTGGGKVVGLDGPAPERVAITEWETLEKAEAFFKSKVWADMTPDREKALKTIRRYAVEQR